MLHDLEILRLAAKELVRVLPRLEHVRRHAAIHLRHLLSHLVGRYDTNKQHLSQLKKNGVPTHNCRLLGYR